MRFLRFTIVWLLLGISVFFACTRHNPVFTEHDAPRHFKELKMVEALLEANPVAALDSVNALIDMSSQSDFTTLDYNELQLRLVQAQYKTRQLSEQSPDLTPVITFYDSLAALFPTDVDLQFLRANAYYYKGVECSFANDDVAAFSHYLNALGVMQQRENWDDNSYASRFIALVYTRLSEILYRYGITEPALTTCQEAASFYKSDADVAAMLRFEAAIHQSEKDYDKAVALYEQSEKLVAVGDDPMQLVIGTKLFELQQYDSAMVHLERAFEKGDRFARVDAAAKLSEIYRTKGLTEEELRYTRFYVENSLMETRMAARKMEIEYLFEEFNHTKVDTSTTEKADGRSSLVLLLLLLLALAFMTYIIVRNRRRISHIENKLSTIEQKHEQETAEKDQEIEQMAQQLSDTRQQLNANRVDFEEAWRSFSESPIVLKIKQSVEGKDIMIKSVGLYPKLKLKEMDYIDLVQATNHSFPDFSSRFLKDHPDLNVADVRHSCLGLLGMNDAEIAVLEGISYSGANRRTNKILLAVNQGDNLEQALVSYLKNLM